MLYTSFTANDNQIVESALKSLGNSMVTKLKPEIRQ